MISEISEIIYREIVPLIFYICIHNLCDIILFSVSGKPERLLWQRMWIQLNHCMRSHLPNHSLHTVSNTQYSIYFLETLENIYFINIRVFVACLIIICLWFCLEITKITYNQMKRHKPVSIKLIIYLRRKYHLTQLCCLSIQLMKVNIAGNGSKYTLSWIIF